MLTSFAKNTVKNSLANYLSKQAFIYRGVLPGKSAFFVGGKSIAGFFLVTLLWSALVQAECSQRHFDERVSIKEIVDGDTLRLTDRRLVRLIGINAPEIGYDGKASEPLAHQARKALRQLIQQKAQVGVVYGKEKHDRYGRLLAHIYLDDGHNVQQLLLEQGMAFWVAIPPNIELLPCYRQAEQKAKQNGLGVWREAYFQPKQVTKQGINGQRLSTGFQFLQGQVQSIYKSHNAFWLKFNDSVALRITQEDLHNFQLDTLENLQGRTVLARGWLTSRKQRMSMRVQHPAAIEIQN